MKLEPTAEQLELIAKATGMAVWEMQIAFDIANHGIPEGAPVGTIARRPDGAVIALRGGVCDERFWIYKWLDDDPNVPTVKDTNDADPWPVIYDPREDEAPRLAEAARKPRVFQSVDPTAQQEPKPCRICNGSGIGYGKVPGGWLETDCAACDATGEAQQEPVTARFSGVFTGTCMACQREQCDCHDNNDTPKPRTPRVVDRLGVDEQGAEWKRRGISRDSYIWEYRFRNGVWQVRLVGNEVWASMSPGTEPMNGPFTEVLEPRVLPSLDCEEARDGTVWEAAFSQSDHGRGWKFWYVLAEREWYTDAGHDGSSPLRTLDFLTERGPYTEVLGDPS